MFATIGLLICIAVVIYSYLVYPLVVWWLSRVFGTCHVVHVAEAELPSMTLILAAYNEEDEIEDRLINALAMDYPAGQIEILVGTDGCNDSTPEIVRRFEDRGVQLVEFAANRGKASVLNDLVARSRGTVLLMSDANTKVNIDAAQRLCRWFGDPEVGVAVGRLSLVDSRAGSNTDSLYWKYETFLKRCEARLDALLGANGAIYAIRRSLYEPIPPQTMIDDFVIPLLAKQRTGCRIIYDCEALAVEKTPSLIRDEFRRRSRIGAGGYQSVFMLWRLLDPRRGWIALTFLSHKILRWACPFCLIGALVTNLALIRRPGFGLLLTAQLGFYLVAGLISLIPPRIKILRPLRLTTMFTSMNLALLIGFFRWARGQQKGSWHRTSRSNSG